MNTKLRTEANDFEKWIIQSLGKQWIMTERKKILDLQLQTKVEVFSVRTKLSHSKMAFRKFISNWNEQNKS